MATKAKKPIVCVGTIEEVKKKGELEGFTLVTTRASVEQILHKFCQASLLTTNEVHGLFIKTHNGEYEKVYGFFGVVPYVNKKLFLIE